MSGEYTALQYAVEIEIDDRFGAVVREVWRNSKGQIDRLGDLPAVTRYCPVTGLKTELIWYRNQKIHRGSDLPAILRYDAETGLEVVRGYRTHHLPDRGENKPSALYHSPEGKLLQRSFSVAGRKHRTDGPALEVFDEKSGNLEHQEFWLAGKPVDPFL
jgi:hypothetical protein